MLMPFFPRTSAAWKKESGASWTEIAMMVRILDYRSEDTEFGGFRQVERPDLHAGVLDDPVDRRETAGLVVDEDRELRDYLVVYHFRSSSYR